MRHARFIHALIPATVFAAYGVAFAATHIDGSLPVYPNAVPRGFTWNTPKIEQALKMGFGIFADSSDSVNTVAAWYQRNLPASCTKETNGVAAGFHCATGVVGIRPQNGKTFIIITPK